jgi:hypothetical protein
MITGIKKNKHWFTDYSYVPTVFMAPKIAGFEDNIKAANICRVFAGIVLGYSFFTKAKWGVVKIIPYKTHAALDFASGVAALAVSQSSVIKNDRQAANTFKIMGLVGVTVGILSLIGAKRS